MTLGPASEVVRIQRAREVTASSGTQPFVAEDYHPQARIPRAPWSVITRETAPSCFAGADEVWEHRRDVAVVALAPYVLDTVRRLGVHDLGPQDAYRALAAGMAPSVLEAAAARFSCDGSAMTSIGWRAVAATTPTLTIDHRSQLKIGLHVDSWDAASLDERSRSRNRLCINLGRYPRYFLFVGLTLQGIWEALARPQLDKRTHLVPLFLESYPDYPVTRLLVEPGHAYIAPTENLPHDGAAAAPGVMDLSYTFLGRFQPDPPAMGHGDAEGALVGV